MEYAAKSNLKKIGLELGGKSPNIILSTYRDAAYAARRSASAAWFNQSEMCTCPSRLIVERAVHEEVVAVLKVRSKNFVPDDPLDPNTKMGAMVDAYDYPCDEYSPWVAGVRPRHYSRRGLPTSR